MNLEIILLGAVFIIVMVVTASVLPSALGFGKGASTMLSICVASLSVLGWLHMGIPPGAILLPYTVLPVALLAALLLGRARRSSQMRKSGDPATRDRRIIRAKDEDRTTRGHIRRKG